MFENSGSNKKCWFCPNSSHMLYKKFLIFFRFRKSKWDFEKYFSSHFIEMRILRWESHLSSPKWELWTENLISLRVKWDFEMRIFFLTSERRFWDEILISKYHLPRSEKIITKEILFWTSLITIWIGREKIDQSKLNWTPTKKQNPTREWISFTAFSRLSRHHPVYGINYVHLRHLWNLATWQPLVEVFLVGWKFLLVHFHWFHFQKHIPEIDFWQNDFLGRAPIRIWYFHQKLMNIWDWFSNSCSEIAMWLAENRSAWIWLTKSPIKQTSIWKPIWADHNGCIRTRQFPENVSNTEKEMLNCPSCNESLLKFRNVSAYFSAILAADLIYQFQM